MASVQDIRDLVSIYVSGEISASDFANRFTPVLKAAIKSNDLAVRELAVAVHAQVSGYFNGFLSDEAFKDNLKPLSERASQGLASLTIQIVEIVKQQPEPMNLDRRSVVFPEMQFTTAT